MGITSILFIVVLLIVAGFVTWAGDTFGRVLGKRRIAFLGLRPKRTSALITVITGILITAGTILILALTNDTLKEMLVNMDRIIRANTELTDENARLISEGNDARQTIDSLQTSIYESETAIGVFRGKLVSAQDELDSLAGEITEREVEIGLLEAERDELQAVTEAKGAEVTRLEGQTSILEQEVSDLESRAVSLNTEISSLNSLITSLNAQVSSLNLRVDALSGQVQSYEVGEVKVFEGQQLVVIPIDTRLTGDRIYNELWLWINAIPGNYKDPITDQLVLAGNEIEITSEQYYEVLEELRPVISDQALVIAYASTNVVENQPVPVWLDVIGNNRMFAEGALVYTNTYARPEEETGQAYRAVLARFFEDARNYLVNERGLIPSTSGEVLQITAEDLLELAERLSDSGFPAQLRIVALVDIYRGNTLRTNIFRANLLHYGENFTVTILPVTNEGDGNDLD